MIVNKNIGKKDMLNFKELLYVIPYSFIMSSINILSSYCVTVMPLAAFMAFKKFVILFVLLTGIAIGIPNTFNKKHYLCIGCIIFGGMMIGERDIFRGEVLGYLSSLVYTLF